MTSLWFLICQESERKVEVDAEGGVKVETKVDNKVTSEVEVETAAEKTGASESKAKTDGSSK